MGKKARKVVKVLIIFRWANFFLFLGVDSGLDAGTCYMKFYCTEETDVRNNWLTKEVGNNLWLFEREIFANLI